MLERIAPLRKSEKNTKTEGAKEGKSKMHYVTIEREKLR